MLRHGMGRMKLHAMFLTVVNRYGGDIFRP